MTLAQSTILLLSAAMLSSAAGARVDPHSVRAELVPAIRRQPAPAFHLRNASGNVVSLSDFAGHAVVLNIWATECGGCKLELPTFAALHRRYDGTGLRVIGVSMDVSYSGLKSIADAWAKVTPFARSHGLGYTILVDDGSVEKAYHVTAMPATFLIDAHGRLAATYVGVVDAESVEVNVKALLEESRQ